MDMKKCTKCGLNKPLNKYHISRRDSDGRADRCKECESKYHKEYYLRNRDKVLLVNKKWDKENRERMNEYRHKWIRNNQSKVDSYWLKHRYGITSDQKDQMRIQQNNKCAICGKYFDNKKFIHVDHDHSSGKIRALLCQKCNLLIGYSKESITVLMSACEYLREWSINRG